jgi:hypothetical protein
MTTTRITTATPGRAGPAKRTVVTKTVTVMPATHTESTPAEAAPSRPAHIEAAPPKPSKTAAHAESDTSSKTTTDHESIRKWAEKRGGHPTSVTGTEHGKETAGVLRLDFGVKDEKLHAVDWDAFFDKFEEANLAFLYQDKTSNGKVSRFHKFIHRH